MKHWSYLPCIDCIEHLNWKHLYFPNKLWASQLDLSSSSSSSTNIAIGMAASLFFSLFCFDSIENDKIISRFFCTIQTKAYISLFYFLCLKHTQIWRVIFVLIKQLKSQNAYKRCYNVVQSYFFFFVSFSNCKFPQTFFHIPIETIFFSE